MTTTNNAAGGQASDGGSDRRSTAGVDTTLPCVCGNVRACSHSTCLEPAALRYDTRRVFCDIHAGEYLRPIIGRELLRLRGVTDYEERVTLSELTGQADFVSFDPYSPRRNRLDIGGGFRSKSFRYGYVVCGKCDASWIGVEHDLCPWCADRVLAHYDNAKRGKS
jgi:hypothetical protein